MIHKNSNKKKTRKNSKREINGHLDTTIRLTNWRVRLFFSSCCCCCCCRLTLYFESRFIWVFERGHVIKFILNIHCERVCLIALKKNERTGMTIAIEWKVVRMCMWIWNWAMARYGVGRVKKITNKNIERKKNHRHRQQYQIRFSVMFLYLLFNWQFYFLRMKKWVEGKKALA